MFPCCAVVRLSRCGLFVLYPFDTTDRQQQQAGAKPEGEEEEEEEDPLEVMRARRQAEEAALWASLPPALTAQTALRALIAHSAELNFTLLKQEGLVNSPPPSDQQQQQAQGGATGGGVSHHHHHHGGGPEEQRNVGVLGRLPRGGDEEDVLLDFNATDVEEERARRRRGRDAAFHVVITQTEAAGGSSSSRGGLEAWVLHGGGQHPPHEEEEEEEQEAGVEAVKKQARAAVHRLLANLCRLDV